MDSISPLLLLLGLDEPETLASCTEAYSHPTQVVFSVPTTVLSKFLKILKSTAPVASRTFIETAFMTFVSKDNGSLQMILSIMAESLDSDPLREVLSLGLPSPAPPPRPAAPAPVSAAPAAAVTPSTGVPRSEVTWSVSTSAPVEGGPRASEAALPRPLPLLPPPTKSTIPLHLAASIPLPTSTPPTIPLALPQPLPAPPVTAVLDTLLKCAMPVPFCTPGSDTTLEPSLLRYGQHITLQSLASGGHLDTGGSGTSGGGGGGGVTLGRGGTWEGGTVWEIVRGCVGEGEGGLEWDAYPGPIHNGDVIRLKSAAPPSPAGGGPKPPPLYLCAAAAAALGGKSSSSHHHHPFPANAGTEARGTLCLPLPMGASDALVAASRWTIVSPDALIAAAAAAATSASGASSSSTPRPFITSGSRIALVSHGGAEGGSVGATASAITALAGGGGSLLKHTSFSPTFHAAAIRLLLLQAPPLTTPNGAPFVDTPLASGLRTGGASSSSSPLSPAAMLHALVLAPPPTTLWVISPVREDGRGPLPCAPEALLVDTTLNGTHAFGPGNTYTPFSARSRGLAGGGGGGGGGGGSMESVAASAAARAAAAAAAATPASSLLLGMDEVGLRDGILKALVGSPSPFVSLRHSPDAAGGGAAAATLTPTLMGQTLCDATWVLHPPPGSNTTTTGPAYHTAARLLPLANYATRVRWWCERRGRPSSGLTGQALARAVGVILKEFHALCSALERESATHTPTSSSGSPPLTLHALWHALQPSLRTLGALHAMLYAPSVVDAQGGALVSALGVWGEGAGDATAAALAHFCAARACEPMLKWLERWMYKGELDDPWGEFFIVENRGEACLVAGGFEEGVAWAPTSPSEPNNTAAAAAGGASTPPLPRFHTYWSSRFTVNKGHLPSFLAPHAATILHTGKCMHVLRLCFEAQASKGWGVSPQALGMAMGGAWGLLGGGGRYGGESSKSVEMGLGACVLYEAAAARAAEAAARVALKGEGEGGGGRGAAPTHSSLTNLADLRGPQVGAGVSTASFTALVAPLHAATANVSSRTSSVVMGDFSAAGGYPGSPRKAGGGGGTGGSSSPGSVIGSHSMSSAPPGSVLDSVFSMRRNSVDSFGGGGGGGGSGASSSSTYATLPPSASVAGGVGDGERPAAGISTSGRVAPIGGGTGGGGGVGVGALDLVLVTPANASSSVSGRPPPSQVLSPSHRSSRNSVSGRSTTSALSTFTAPVASSIARLLTIQQQQQQQQRQGSEGISGSHPENLSAPLSLETLVTAHARSSLNFSFTLPSAGPIPFSPDPSAYTSRIAAAHSAASLQLLAHLYNSGKESQSPPGGSSLEDDLGAAGRHKAPLWLDTEFGGEGDDEALAGISAGGPLYGATPLLGSLSDTWSAQGLLGAGGDLRGRLNTLRTFFFAARADWLGSFLENAGPELRREVVWGGVGVLSPSSSATLNRLRGSLETAFRSSLVVDDPHRDAISLHFSGYSLVATLEHYEAGAAAAVADGDEGEDWTFHGNPPPPPPPTFLTPPPPPSSDTSTVANTPAAAPKPLHAYTLLSLSLSTVPWPASLVLDPPSLTRYSLLFRHLLLIRTAEEGVRECWGALQRCKSLRGVRTLLAGALTLRARMGHFLRSVLFHFTNEVLEPAWGALGGELRVAPTLDAVWAGHGRFLGAAWAGCFLAPPARGLLRLHIRLTNLCILFSGNLTAAIEGHLLSEEALDARAGVNRAGRRREREGGEGGGGGGGTLSWALKGNSGSRSRSGSVSSLPPSSALPPSGAATTSLTTATTTATGGQSTGTLERQRRAGRLAAQSEALRAVLGQKAWQGMIAKSCGIWDDLSGQFRAHLEEASAAGEEGCATLLQALFPPTQ